MADNWNTKNIFIDGDNIKELFELIDKDILEVQEINTIEDFYEYIKATITSNIEYDFGVSLDSIGDIEQVSLYELKGRSDVENQLDWSRDYVESEYGIKLTYEEALELAETLAEEVFDSVYLAECQSEVERQCIEEFVDELQEERIQDKDLSKPQHDVVKSNQKASKETITKLQKTAVEKLQRSYSYTQV